MPKANEAEAAVVKEVRRVPVSTLMRCYVPFQEQEEIQPTAYKRRLFEERKVFREDFQDVKDRSTSKDA